MDGFTLTLIFIVIIFIITIYKAKKNDVDILQNIIQIIIYSFIMAGGITLAISLIVYALTGNIIAGLTNDILRAGVLLGGLTLLGTELKDLYEKYNHKET